MKASRIASAVLALIALATVALSAVFVAESVPRSESAYTWVFVAGGAIVVLCALVVVVLTLSLTRIAPASLTSSPRVPLLLTALTVTLGILTLTMLALVAFLMWGAGLSTASGRLITVWLSAGALVSAAMMMIAVGFRTLLGKYRVANAELAVVI
jgi:hypothetical protein